MPIYEYKSIEGKLGCPYCRNGFECIRRISDPPLTACPKCKTEVVKLISAPSIGASKTGFDDRAKAAGFHKLKKLGTGEYEKQY